MGETRLACAGMGYAIGACGSVTEFERSLYSGTPVEAGRSWPVERVLAEALRDAAVSERDECVVTVHVTDGLPKALDRAARELTDADVVLVCAELDGGAVAVALTKPARPAPKIYATLTVPETTAQATLTDVVTCALRLYFRYLPPAPENGGASCPWLREADGGPLRGTVGGLSLTGATTRDQTTALDWHHATDVVLLPVCGKNTEDLVRAITGVKEAVEAGADLAELVADDPEAPLRAVFCAPPASIIRELDRALASLPRAHAEGKDWASPSGSFCAARPIGPDGRVALVYPGLFGLYSGLSRELMRLFPMVHAELESLAFAAGRVGYRDLAQRLMGTDDEVLLERELVNDLGALCSLGVAFTTAHTRLLRVLLGRRDFGALGYSLGEVSMVVAAQTELSDLWAVDEAATTPLLSDGIAASERVVREKWRIPDSETGPIWGSRVVVGDPASVRAAVDGRERVFLSHINTPGEVVLTGDPAECAAVATELGLPSVPSAHSHIFHTPLMELDYFDGAFGRSVALDPGVELFSAFENRPLPRGAGDIGDRIATMLSRRVDFAKVVRAAYVQGYRYFLEVGPGGVCTRWIGDTLAGRPHVAVPLERRGAPTVNTVAGLLARLASNGVAIDLTAFLPVQKETT